METHVVQFPSRAFAHVAPPWSEALHASPSQFARARSSHSSDDLMLTERDLDLPAHVLADKADAPSAGHRPR